MPPSQTKRCPACGVEQPTAAFYRSRNQRDGLASQCRACYKERTRSYANRTPLKPIKRCPACGIDKPVTEFHRSKGQYDGLSSQCRACRQKYRRAVYVPKEHTPRVTAAGHCFCQACETWQHVDQFYEDAGRPKRICKTCYKAATKAAYQQNQAAEQERAKQKYHNNKDYYRERQRLLRQAFPARARARTEHYRARRVGCREHFTAEEWASLCSHYQHRCVCCREAKPLTVDHVVPLSKGGTDTIDNIQPLCGSCNSTKRDKTIDYRW